MGWFRKTSEPPPRHSANPGDGTSVQVAFTDGEKRWSATEDLLDSLARTLSALGYPVKKHREWLELGELQLVPRFVGLQPRERGGVSTVSTIQVSHPALIPEGVFEYQHAAKGWAETDLPVFLDAQRAGMDALIEYAKSWPFNGLEYRKQYVFLQSLDDVGDGEPA